MTWRKSGLSGGFHGRCSRSLTVWVYLRLLGIPVPMTYGSTADHAMF